MQKEMDGSIYSSHTQTSRENQKGTTLITKTTIVFLALLLVGAIGAAGYFYKQFSDLRKNLNQVAQKELDATVAAVGKLIILPADEQPTMATVTDPEKLREQPFFAKAQKGDIVLIYTNAKKAILYSVEMNKIIEVAPINIGSSQLTQPK